MEKPIIIVSVGKSTQILYDGKAYGNHIKELNFHHKAGENAEVEIKEDENGLAEMGEDAEALKNAIRSIIDE
ncbi:MAG: hypothetical protein IJO85_07330 [Lachnospiraceae bacterium]|nr:hypothetical protein [Lachnospiraceae bacterium]